MGSKADKIAAAGEAIHKTGCAMVQGCFGLAMLAIGALIAWAYLIG